MTGEKKKLESQAGPGRTQVHTEGPGWANGLKQLYKSVVDEDIPDSFKDLLDKLDDNGKR